MDKMYFIGRKHERKAIKEELNQMVDEKKTKIEIIEYIRKL